MKKQRKRACLALFLRKVKKLAKFRGRGNLVLLFWRGASHTEEEMWKQNSSSRAHEYDEWKNRLHILQKFVKIKSGPLETCFHLCSESSRICILYFYSFQQKLYCSFSVSPLLCHSPTTHSTYFIPGLKIWHHNVVITTYSYIPIILIWSQPLLEPWPPKPGTEHTCQAWQGTVSFFPLFLCMTH